MKNLILTLLLICFATSIYANPPIGARSVILNARFEAGNSTNPNYVSIQTNGPGGKFVRELNTNYRDNLDSIKLVGDISYYDLKLLTNMEHKNFKALKYIDLSDANIVAFNRLDYTDYNLQKVDDFLCEATGGTYGCELQRYEVMEDTISWCYVSFEDRDFDAGYLPDRTFETTRSMLPLDYYQTPLDNLILPSNLDIVGDSAFVGIIPFTAGHKMTLTIPETVTKIGKYAFIGNFNSYKWQGHDSNYAFDTIVIKSNVEIERHAFTPMNQFVIDAKAFAIIKFDILSPNLSMEQNSFFDNFGYLDLPIYTWRYVKPDFTYQYIYNLTGFGYNQSARLEYMKAHNVDWFPNWETLQFKNASLLCDSMNVGSIPLYVTKDTKSYYQNSNVWKYFDLVEFGNSIPTYLADTKSLEIKIYPNPFHEGFYVNSNEVSQTYSIINISGSVLQTFSANKEQYIDMSSFSNGIYFLKNNDDNSCTKLIKQ